MKYFEEVSTYIDEKAVTALMLDEFEDLYTVIASVGTQSRIILSIIHKESHTLADAERILHDVAWKLNFSREKE